MKLIFFLIIFLKFLFISNAFSIETYVVLKVNNKIITNVDINKEFRYLIALSPNLQNVDEEWDRYTQIEPAMQFHPLQKMSVFIQQGSKKVKHKVEHKSTNRDIISTNWEGHAGERVLKWETD